jgi:hypothetical protein
MPPPADGADDGDEPPMTQPPAALGALPMVTPQHLLEWGARFPTVHLYDEQALFHLLDDFLELRAVVRGVCAAID